MADSEAVTGAPANGDPSINPSAVTVSSNGSRRKVKSPRELYQMMYDAKVSSGDLKNLHIGSDSQVPPQVVGYLKRRMTGAATRVASLKREIGTYRQTIHNRSRLSLTSSEVNAIRSRRLEAHAALLTAKDEYEMFKQFYEEALKTNAVRLKNKITSAREDAYAERMAPSKAKAIIDRFTEAGNNGKADEVSNLKAIASGPRDTFRQKCLELIQALDRSLFEQLTQRPKLQTRVVGRIATHFTSVPV